MARFFERLNKKSLRDFLAGVLIMALAFIGIIFYHVHRNSGFSNLDVNGCFNKTVNVLYDSKNTVYINDSVSIDLACDATKPYPITLVEYLTESDSISKRCGSDTIWVYRKSGKAKFFILNVPR